MNSSAVLNVQPIESPTIFCRNSQPCQIEKAAIFGRSATTLMLLKGEFEYYTKEKEQVEIINTPGLYHLNSGSGFFKAASVMQVQLLLLILSAGTPVRVIGAVGMQI